MSRWDGTEDILTDINKLDLPDLIAFSVRPWIGDGYEPSVGATALNDILARRAANNVIKMLIEAGYTVTKT